MGDKMYTVEKIEETQITLEDRTNNNFFVVDKCVLPSNIKEKDILDFVDNKYIINKQLTDKTKKDLKNRFNSLMN